MMESLDAHVLDLFQNSLASGATEISVRLLCRLDESRLRIEIEDNGNGMDEETLAAVRRGYFSSKCERCVGLGIPLLRETAEHCGGAFSIESRPGAGTHVAASFDLGHIDLPPFGDLIETLLTLLFTSGNCRVRIDLECNGSFAIDTASLEKELGDVPRTHPDVMEFLRQVLRDEPVIQRLRKATDGGGTAGPGQSTITYLRGRAADEPRAQIHTSEVS